MCLKSPSPPLPFSSIQCCDPITLLDASFDYCNSTLFRRGRGKKHKIVQIAVFPIIFVPNSGLSQIYGCWNKIFSFWKVFEAETNGTADNTFETWLNIHCWKQNWLYYSRRTLEWRFVNLTKCWRISKVIKDRQCN